MMRLRPGRECVYCGVILQTVVEVHPGHKHPASATRDHVFPKSLGGHAQVPCCHGCNVTKGNMLPSEWLAYVLETMPHRAEHVREVFRRFRINWTEPALDDSSPTVDA